jgi:O-Antigen ligase
MLAKGLLIAAAYRAVMCWCFYFMYVRPMVIPLPEYITTHDDSVLWVVAILLLGLRMIRTSRMSERIFAGLFILLLLGAIQFNTRRLAWVSLAMGLVVFFLLMPPGRTRRRAVRALMVLVPVAAIYVGVGWGRTERIFKPLQALAQVTSSEKTEDLSTKSRDVENLGLIHTAQANGWLIGTGWGHEYTPVSLSFDLTQYFKLWRYIPHNSILGLFAFMGAFGFCGYWLAYPTAIFLNARVAKLARSEAARDVGLMGAVQMVVCVNQYFGDMGIFSYKVVYIMSASYAIALRMPVLSGVWAEAGVKATQRARPRRAQVRAQEQGAWQS